MEKAYVARNREKALKVMDKDGLQQTISSPKEEPRGGKSCKTAAQNRLFFGQSYINTFTVMSTFSEKEEGVVSGHIVSSQNHFAKPSVPHAEDAAFQTLHACMDPFKKVTEEEELSGSLCICTALPCCR